MVIYGPHVFFNQTIYSKMSIQIVQLGTPRSSDEGVRIGTVRRPPRGVPKSEFSKQNWYDVYFPNLAPSAVLMKQGKAADSPDKWRSFSRKYRQEMAAPSAQHDLKLLAALSHTTHFSVGCYCKDKSCCHRTLLEQLLLAAGADVVREEN